MHSYSYKNVEMAFNGLYEQIQEHGEKNEGTVRLTGVLVEILDPLDYQFLITPWRKFSENYVKLEWEWYMSKNKNPLMVEGVAPIWKKMKDANGEVNSNYGYQVARNNQWAVTASSIADAVLTGKGTRKHVVSIFDGKEKHLYGNDCPCTVSFTFIIKGDTLDIHTHMRSNDLWYGFCNDIPAFGMFLNKMCTDVTSFLRAAGEVHKTMKVGRLIHFVDDMHLYDDFLNLRPEDNENE